jgi:hypothetical protein
MRKQAYPTGFADSLMEAPADLNKWTQTMNQIYQTINKTGQDFNQVFDQVTAGWNVPEKLDFRSWMSFYQSGAHKAYKLAQYYGNNLDILKAPKPDMSGFPVAKQLDDAAEIENKIKALVGRLAAAERIATHPLVKAELNKRIDIGLRKWLEELHNLKRQIQLASIKNASVEEIVTKAVNKLSNEGFIKAAAELAKVADVNIKQAEPPEQIPSTTPLSPLPAANFSSAPATKNDGQDAINKLIEGMNPDGEEDDNKVVDIHDDPIAEMHIKAQMAPPQLDTIPLEEMPAEKPKDFNMPVPMEQERDVFDSALRGISISDVIKKFEAIANVLRNREIPRQLSEGDLMLDHLGFLSFFPSLGEALSKTLESNQYALTRIEDILSKLRGAVQTPKENEIELKDNQQPMAPELTGIRNKLHEQGEQEKIRKEKRKQEELEKAIGPKPPPPITNVQEGLQQPVTLPTQPAPLPE